MNKMINYIKDLYKAIVITYAVFKLNFQNLRYVRKISIRVVPGKNNWANAEEMKKVQDIREHATTLYSPEKAKQVYEESYK
jgi:hypothetical protein